MPNIHAQLVENFTAKRLIQGLGAKPLRQAWFGIAQKEGHMVLLAEHPMLMGVATRIGGVRHRPYVVKKNRMQRHTLLYLVLRQKVVRQDI